ncbi:MAG: hypothetical protein MNPFHGCM_01270 [Gemmatimonadaceae bacterium]|nr:hypothetical protein [Gemmatimonadaceae bacterium]
MNGGRLAALGLGVLSPVFLGAQAVALQIRPRAGDTLRLRIEQSVEVSGTTRKGNADLTNSESHAMVALTRVAIEATDLAGATVTAMTDSVHLTGTSGKPGGSLLGWAKALEGQRFRFRIAVDGTPSMEGPGAGAAPHVGAFLAQLPASLPKEPVAPGSSWERRMEIPMSALSAARGTAVMTATFRLDSLGRGGNLAFLSVSGRLSRHAAPPVTGGATTVEANGTVTGSVVVDRQRGWITDARSTINVRSLVPGEKPDQPPMQVRVKITQWMRAK